MRIALGDLRHSTIGRHSILMPVGIGYIASYLLSKVDSKEVEIKLFDDPVSILEDIKSWQPDVIGLSNYMWNTEISHFVFKKAKELIPNVICIAGGPHFPTEINERREYLLKRPYCDFFVYFEGEISFSILIQKLLNGENLKTLRTKRQNGIASIHPDTKELIIGDSLPRISNLDEIPSPYLNGLMDQFFNGQYAPTIETVRGCPFTCGFCYAGQDYYKKMTMFSIERIKEELDYITERMKDHPHIYLELCDSNFGMTRRDEEIAEHIRSLQDEYSWPMIIDVSTGKRNYNRILHIASRLRNTMFVTCSVQSLNPETLRIIKRQNIPMDEYKEIQEKIRKKGMPSAAEYILPMPMESKNSFFDGVKKLFDADVKVIVPYTTMVLQGTFLASKECRENFKYQTKFRVLPRQFGEYLGEKIFEIEEVCVSTNTLSFQDYLECRGFALIAALLSSEQFDLIFLHLDELKIDLFEYLFYIWDLIKSENTELSDIYFKFLKETESELWDSEEALNAFYNNEENYNKLSAGELGDNLMRKYKTIIFLEYSVSAINLFYFAFEKFLDEKNLSQDIRESLNAAKTWMISCRDFKAILNIEESNHVVEDLSLDYDINEWYMSREEKTPLISYKKKVNYAIYFNEEQIKAILDEGRKTYGDDIYFRIGKILICNWGTKNFWRQCNIT